MSLNAPVSLHEKMTRDCQFMQSSLSCDTEENLEAVVSSIPGLRYAATGMCTIRLLGLVHLHVWCGVRAEQSNTPNSRYMMGTTPQLNSVTRIHRRDYQHVAIAQRKRYKGTAHFKRVECCLNQQVFESFQDTESDWFLTSLPLISTHRARIATY